MSEKQVSGVIVSKVDFKLIVKKLETLGIQPPTDVGAAIKALTDYYGTQPPANLVKCDACEGVSSISEDNCPYCGMGDEPPKGVTVRDKSEKSSEAAPEATKEQKVVKVKNKKPPVQPQTTTALAKAEPTAMTKGKVVEGHIEPQGTIEELNKSVESIAAAKGMAAKSHWVIGKLIAENYDKALWKLRVGHDEKPLYKSFNSFCENELKISAAHAYNLMDIARAFTEEQVTKFGPSKLGLVLQVPPEDQAKLLEQAAGASKRELEKKVKETKEKNKKEGKATSAPKEGRKKDVSKATAKSGATGKGAPTKTGTSKKDIITIASIVGSKTVKLFATPAKKGDPAKEAKKLADDPWGRLELENNVEMFFKVKTNPAGQLILQVATRRMNEQ